MFKAPDNDQSGIITADEFDLILVDLTHTGHFFQKRLKMIDLASKRFSLSKNIVDLASQIISIVSVTRHTSCSKHLTKTKVA